MIRYRSFTNIGVLSPLTKSNDNSAISFITAFLAHLTSTTSNFPFTSTSGPVVLPVGAYPLYRKVDATLWLYYYSAAKLTCSFSFDTLGMNRSWREQVARSDFKSCFGLAIFFDPICCACVSLSTTGFTWPAKHSEPRPTPAKNCLHRRVSCRILGVPLALLCPPPGGFATTPANAHSQRASVAYAIALATTWVSATIAHARIETYFCVIIV